MTNSKHRERAREALRIMKVSEIMIDTAAAGSAESPSKQRLARLMGLESGV